MVGEVDVRLPGQRRVRVTREVMTVAPRCLQEASASTLFLVVPDRDGMTAIEWGPSEPSR